MMKASQKLSLALLMMATACADISPTMRPDYAIRVVPTAQGGVALAPACPSYAAETANPFDNQPMPQFGCADARNLAAMVERPNDLVQPQDIGPMRGVAAVGAERRYDNNQTRGLIWTGADTNVVAATSSPAPASQMSGDNAVQSGSSATAATAP